MIGYGLRWRVNGAERRVRVGEREKERREKVG